MFCCDLFVVDYEYSHVFRIDVVCGCEFVLAVIERNDDCKFSSHTLLGFNGDGAVHELNDVLCDRHAETRAAVFVIAAAVFLCERIEDLRDEILLHSDTRILYRQFQCRMVAVNSHALNDESYTAGRVCELDRVGQNVDNYLLELHVVADVVVADTTGNSAFVMKSLLIALGHYHVVYLFEHVAEREFFLADRESS